MFICSFHGSDDVIDYSIFLLLIVEVNNSRILLDSFLPWIVRVNNSMFSNLTLNSFLLWTVRVNNSFRCTGTFERGHFSNLII